MLLQDADKFAFLLLDSIPTEMNLWANWHSLEAVRAGCLLFWRVLQQCVRAVLGILTFWLLPSSWLQITIKSNCETLISESFSPTSPLLRKTFNAIFHNSRPKSLLHHQCNSGQIMPEKQWIAMKKVFKKKVIMFEGSNAFLKYEGSNAVWQCLNAPF